MPGRTRSLASAAPCFSEAAGWCRIDLLRLAPVLLAAGRAWRS